MMRDTHCCLSALSFQGGGLDAGPLRGPMGRFLAMAMSIIAGMILEILFQSPCKVQ